MQRVPLSGTRLNDVHAVENAVADTFDSPVRSDFFSAIAALLRCGAAFSMPSSGELEAFVSCRLNGAIQTGCPRAGAADRIDQTRPAREAHS